MLLSLPLPPFPCLHRYSCASAAIPLSLVMPAPACVEQVSRGVVDKLPILLAPSPHLRVQIDNRTDVIDAEGCQKLKPEGTLYVDLGSTHDACADLGRGQ
jgi:hypothetical protein